MNDVAAHEVCAADKEIDEINREVFHHARRAVIQKPALFESLLQVMHIARHLERIADHATNMAEDLIYMIEGRIVRHTAEVACKAENFPGAGMKSRTVGACSGLHVG